MLPIRIAANRNCHDDDLSELAANDHVALAESIGQVTGRCSEKQIGQHKAARANGQNRTHVVLVDVLLADSNHEPAQNIVVRGAEELRQQQPDKCHRHQPIALLRMAFPALRVSFGC